MLSAPLIIPATRQGTFSGALTPHGPPGRTCSATSSGRGTFTICPGFGLMGISPLYVWLDPKYPCVAH